MLRSVAHTLTGTYGVANVYRDGGDESVVLLPMIERGDFETMRAELLKSIDADKRHTITVGFEWTGDAGEVLAAIRRVDMRMYRDKAEYYSR